MLAKRIIPCLDVTSGRVVKGVNFVGLRDAGDPVEIARRYDQQGADELCFLDITASSDERGIILHIIEAVASQVFIPLTVGGGVRSVQDVRDLLNAGADKVSINTAAVANPDLVSQASGKVGSQCIVVAVDAKRAGDGADLRWEVFTHGGRRPTGIDALEWGRRVQALGAGEILLTSMDRDGTRNGFDLELTRAFSDALEIPVIASGGVGNLDHLVQGVLEGHADAVLAASIFHYGEFTVGEAKRHMAAHRHRGADMSEVEAGWLDAVKWDADGLVAAVAQDAASGRVLMLAWMNREALELTARDRRGGVLVALARATVAQGRGIRARATGARHPAGLRRGCCAAERRAGGWHRLSHRARALLLSAPRQGCLDGDRAGPQGPRRDLSRRSRTGRAP